MMKPHYTFKVVLFLFGFLCLVPGASKSTHCKYPDLNDPDDYFDHIGRFDFCEPEATQKSRIILDNRNFGSGKWSTDNGDQSSDGARAVVMGPGAKIYMAGRNGGANNNFMIMSLFQDGSLDTTFSTSGIAVHSLGDNDDIPHAIALQANGMLVVAGRSDATGSVGAFDFGVLRLTSNGALDTTFNTTGKIKVDISGGVDIARSVKVQANSMIVVAGYGASANYEAEFVRLTTDGRLDTTFSTDAKASFSIGAGHDAIMSVTVDSDAKIVGVGTRYNEPNWAYSVLRLVSSGTYDTTFNTNGKTVLTVGSSSSIAYGVAFNTTNQLYVAGSASNGSDTDFAIVKFLSSGSLDTTFATTGIKTQAVLSSNDAGFGISLETSGRVALVAGFAYNGSNNDFAVVRFGSNGTKDATFGTSGIFRQPFNSAEDTAQAIAMYGDGIIMAAGRTDTGAGGGYDFALMRIQSNGTLAVSGDSSASFGGGEIAISVGTDYGWGIAAETTGKIIFVGAFGGDAGLARLLVSGSLDTTFFTTGKQSIDSSAADTDIGYEVTVQTNARILLSGMFRGKGATNRFGVARVTTAGALDATYGTNGLLTMGVGSAAYAIYVNTANRDILMGQDSAAADIMVVQLSNTGNLDTAFNTDGITTWDSTGADQFSYGALDSQQRPVALSYCSNDHTFSLIRWQTTGSLDTAFNTTGKLTINPSATLYFRTGGQSLARFSDDSFAVGLIADTSGIAFPAWVYKISSDGIVDTSFNTSGRITVSVLGAANPYLKSVTVAPNDKLYISIYDGTSTRIIRCLADGTLDTTFSTDGNSRPSREHESGVVIENGWYCGAGTAGTLDGLVVCYWP